MLFRSHQNGLTLAAWARDCTGPLFGTFHIRPVLQAAINPFFVIAFTPLLVGFWQMLRRRKKEPSTPAKIGYGMILTAAAFGIMAIAGLAGGDYGIVSPFWLISSYAVVTIGELCLSPMGLSFVSKTAPVKIRGLMMGCWFGATAIGNYLSGAVKGLWDIWPHSAFFSFLVFTSLIAAVIMFLFLKKVNKATGNV